MLIQWFGYSCFKMEFGSRGATKVSLVTDPFEKEGRNGLPRTLSADIVTVSHQHPRHNNIEAVNDNPFVIDGPGEYDIKEVSINGVQSFHDGKEGKVRGNNTIFYYVIEDLHIAHLGDLSHKLDDSHFVDLHNIDILLVPVGGKDTLDAKAAVEVVAQFEPRIIIPMHYAGEKFGNDLDGVEPFLKAMGASSPERVNKLKITARELPQEEAKIIIIDQQ